MKLLHVLSVSVLICAVCVPACAAPVPKPRKAPAPTVTKSHVAGATGLSGKDAELLGLRVSPEALTQVQSVPTRAAVVGSLLAHGPSNTHIQSLARARGMTGAQLQTRSLSGANLSNLKVRSATSVLETVLADVPTYDELDWYGGIHFTPLAPSPRFKVGTHVFRLCVMGCDDICTGGSLGLAEMCQHNVLRLQSQGTADIDLWLDMPSGPGTYAATIKLAPVDGRTFTEWVDRTRLGYLLSAGIRTGTDGVQASLLSLAPLSDGTGAIAMFTLDPTDMDIPPEELQDLSMRKINAKLSFGLGVPYARCDLLFGGVKIEKF